MKVCIPALDSNGFETRVSPHFGRSPHYVIIDTETSAMEKLDKPEGGRGRCLPVHLLAGAGVDVVVCQGIGRGAVNHLASAGIRVMGTTGRTVHEVIHEQAAIQAPFQVPGVSICEGHRQHHHRRPSGC